MTERDRSDRTAAEKGEGAVEARRQFLGRIGKAAVVPAIVIAATTRSRPASAD